MEFKNVERLMMFLEVVDKGSFTDAKDALGISKGYLSKQIKALEEDLKTKLLVRSTRHMRLTSEGQRAYKHGLAIKAQIQAFEGNVQEENERISGLLRITAPKMFTEVLLVDICAAFQLQHPEIRFEIHSSFTTYDLMQNEIDLAIRATLTPPDNMVAKRLLSYHHILVSSPEYLKNHGSPVAVHDLNTHQCLATQHQLNWPMRNEEYKVDGWLSINENHLLKQLALNHKGIIRVPNYYVSKEIKNGLLTEVLPNEACEQGNDVYLLYPQLTYTPTKLKTFIDFLQSALASR
ncbi:LysR family transcriptional regulator [uncultured Vibrio sp.]|uniref:LysR family transcriptional regulator n=1 Tax=uncultured Vibrio sp. TaxID=114054 RepID=UPI0025E4C343|nr:LysR family transcriptional regulator [uncultured Vibrio sp.]